MKNKPLDFYERKLESLKTSKNNIFNFTAINQKATYASYKISLRIAQTGKPHTIGESLILPAIKDAVGITFDQKFLKDIEKLSLSNNTVFRRIDEISEWVECKLIEKVNLNRWFSLQIDESTDIQGLSQIIVFVRYIWMNECHEDFLCCEPIIRGTSNEIFNTLNNYVTAKGIEWSKCIGLCTDGARAMCGRNSSVITKIREINLNVPWMHCNIHREALVSKSLSDDFRSVLNTSVKIVNYIKAKPLQSRLFEKLCEEMGSNHKLLLLHSEVRWLSRGKVLTRLVELREEVTYYLDEKTDYIKFLCDEKFILKLTYLADIFSKLN
uniref:Zinc finger BED domain-containing protein 5 n=1 Tax=Sipha flava TaxID=143950 RepID=A0A2S2Q132_9HEMI